MIKLYAYPAIIKPILNKNISFQWFLIKELNRLKRKLSVRPFSLRNWTMDSKENTA